MRRECVLSENPGQRPFSSRGAITFAVAAAAALLSASPAAAQGPCPYPNTCTLWPAAQTPATPSIADPSAVELGVKFRASTDGYITAIRFYKSPSNTGTHLVNLWTRTGTLLMRATAGTETTSGWQEVTLPSPVPITANTVYVASYHTNAGFYAGDSGYFAGGATLNGPLEALQNGVDDGNGVFLYGNTAFPTDSYQSTNYWVDVVFATSLPPDTTPPTVRTTSPKPGTPNVAIDTTVSAVFSEWIDPATLTTATFQLLAPGNVQVAGTITYAASTQTATFRPTTPLARATTYTGAVIGGPSGVKDLAGNPVVDMTWTFTTANPAAPPPTVGPGGPILVVTATANPFTVYLGEILRGEGLNEFAFADIGAVTSTSLATYDVVILGEMPLTAAQVSMFSDWVTTGGNLIAMRPDKQLATLLGLTDANAVLPDGYIQIDTSAAPGAGIVGTTMQYHGAADRYTLNGAVGVATLFSNATTGTSNPAVTVRSVGAAGGQAAAFTYDLARSVVYTRQGNPAWAGQERDGQLPRRSDDLFFGGAEPDYVDRAKIAIPQADEQQRLLVNLINFVNADRKPLPRFWYFPRGVKAVVVMTGDDHAHNGTQGRFDIYNGNSPPGCVVDNWECVRATSYMYQTTPMTQAAAAGYVAQGFELGVHITTLCGNYTPETLETSYARDLGEFIEAFPDVPKARTNRTHCIPWSDYDTQPQVALAHNIRLDTNYYYWPSTWVNNVPGLFTGSAMPQRFTKADGTIIDVYQATTQMTDESAQVYPFTADVLFDRAIGPEGYYGAFVTNMHTDTAVHPGSAAIVSSAQTRGIPIVSAEQLLDWTDGRNASSFRSITWNGTILSFTVSLWAKTTGIQALVPFTSPGGTLVGVLSGSVPVGYSVETIKGVAYARFPVNAGSYQVRYGADTVGPAISALAVAPSTNSAVVTWQTNEPATTRISYGLSPSSLVFSTTVAGLSTAHTINLTGLAAGTTYYYRVTSADASNNSTSAPSPNGTFTTAAAAAMSVGDTTVADFTAGTLDAATYVAEMADGELLLMPSAGSEFSGTLLPAGWSDNPWDASGAATVSGGQLSADATRVGTDALFTPGRTLEFSGSLSGQAFQHAGLGVTFVAPPWAIFSTGAGGTLFARTNNGSVSLDTQLTGVALGVPHRFQIDWTPTAVVYWVDGTQVASHAIAISQDMRVNFSDASAGGGTVTVNWAHFATYATSTTFTSRVMDAQTDTQWASVSWLATIPAGTSVAVSARFGNTPAPDGTWTPFIAVSGSGGAVSQTSRYVQYQAVLSGNGSATPILQAVAVNSASTAPSISVGDITVAEADVGTPTTATFTLTLSTPMQVQVSVNYATANGTATAGSDYVAKSGTAVFNPGETTVTIPVTVNGDAAVENNETFFLNLTSPVNAAIADPQGIATIVDNDVNSVSIAGATVAEGNAGVTNATFVVTLSRPIPQTVTVDYTTVDGTAVAGSDYTVTAGTLTFAANTVQQSIIVPVTGDTLNEADETFQVRLSNATNATIATAQATGTITNDDPVVTVSVGDLSITEGSGGTVTAQVPVTLSAAAGQDVSVGYTTSNLTATTADYTTTTGTLTFPAGTTSLTIPVPIATDLAAEPDETFRMTLRTPVNVTIARAQATITILNDDNSPTISIANLNVNEGNTGTANASFTVTLSHPSSSVITVNYATSDGSAIAGVDYTAASGQLSFAANATSRTITVPIIGDTIDEPNETFTVTLSTPVNATIANGQATGTIVDNDATPSIRISDVTVTEGDAGTLDATLNVTLSNPSSTPITVTYRSGTTGTATPSVDFTPVGPTVLTFAPGQTAIPIAVPLVGDLLNEASETVHVDLSGQSANATIADSRGIVTITDNDPLPVIDVADVSVSEGNSGTKTVNFTFTLSAPSGRSVSVAYATANGTATAGTTAGSDYTARSGTLTFAAGVTTMTLAITVRGDTTLEPNETVLLNLGTVTNATLARTSATLTILNDDQ